MIEDLRSASARTVGTKQTIKAIEGGRADLVFIAEDADDFLKKRIIQLCEKNQVPFAYAKTMQELGESCGIQVGAAAAARLK